MREWVPLLVPVLLSFILLSGAEARHDYGEDEASQECGGGTYDLSMSYFVCVNLLVNYIIKGTPAHGYDYATSGVMSANCYGYGKCDRSLTSSDCENCLNDAIANVLNECKLRFEARIELASVGWDTSIIQSRTENYCPEKNKVLANHR